MPPTPNPETERLTKRRHIVQEVIDTEYSHHQDMKIIEDIYKRPLATSYLWKTERLFWQCRSSREVLTRIL